MPITAKELIEAEDAVTAARKAQDEAWARASTARQAVQTAERAYEEAQYAADLAEEELDELKDRIRNEGL